MCFISLKKAEGCNIEITYINGEKCCGIARFKRYICYQTLNSCRGLLLRFVKSTFN